jgi:hypothetical protein
VSFEIDVGDEDVVVKIEEAKQRGIGKGVLDENAIDGEGGFAWWSDGCDGRDYEEKDDKENMREPTYGFLLLLLRHPAGDIRKCREYSGATRVLGVKRGFSEVKKRMSLGDMRFSTNGGW